MKLLSLIISNFQSYAKQKLTAKFVIYQKINIIINKLKHY